MYHTIIRPLLFKLDAEQAHHITFRLIKFIHKLPFVGVINRAMYCVNLPNLARTVFGLTFKNPVGLAAGFDKDAKLLNQWGNYGFGFVEIGTITPKAQAGNEQPRLFRLVSDSAIINRMGFNNEGVLAAIDRLKKRDHTIIIGGNIGKNKLTPNENAVDDYVLCFEALFNYVDYFVVNVSSPNTPNLRALQDKEPLQNLLATLQNLNLKKDKPKPILLKIAPDLTNTQLNDIIEIIALTGIAGVVATNTTLSREGLTAPKVLIEQQGGLSGKPITARATEIVAYLHTHGKGAFPIIAVGGIFSPQDAHDKLNAGASLVQVYTGFIYEGPSLVKNINSYLSKI
ncbi:MAG: quinone-dependent dihydroorotate dehydrogenase [Bacteroidia bacterium]|nr:quinone-dependent dihydroorotate dehydrogenase [Bacteroidia bacterium]